MTIEQVWATDPDGKTYSRADFEIGCNAVNQRDGDTFPCQLPRGHRGMHVCEVTLRWGDMADG